MTEPTTAPARPQRKWVGWLTRLAIFLCFASLVAALVAAIGSGQGLWHFSTGFLVLRYAVFAAGGGALLALVALLVGFRRRGRLYPWAGLGLIAAAGLLLYVGSLVRTAYSVPAIHDVTTNLEDPPLFTRLQIRPDNLETVPAAGRPDLERLPPEQRWRALHREAYGDLATVRVPWDVAETVRRAAALVEARGWELVSSDPGGTVEATDTSLFFRFKDDVVIRVRPAPGGGSLVDIRSISRVGVSDVGVNAKRIRAFLADLRAS